MSGALFEPYQLHAVTVANRVVAAPLASRSFDRGGYPTERTLEIYREYAASGAGLAVVEHHAVHSWGRNRHEQARLDADEVASSLVPLTSFFHEKGMPVIAQISFAGSMTADATLLDEDDFEYVSPSGIKTERDQISVKPRPLEKKQIGMIVEAFAEAALRAVNIAGYDGVQIHSAHGYLLGSFLSPLTNHRDDSYGGSEAKRARLLYEITDAVRNCIPKSLLSVRLGAADHMPWESQRGLTVDETSRVARELAALGADWIAVSGNHCGYGEQINDDRPYFAPYARVLREAVRGEAPIDCTGGVRSRESAEKLLADGISDLVGVGRLFRSKPNFLHEVWR